MLHQIGAGALGPVFRAYQPEPGRLVAVKLFRIDLPPERAHKLVAEFEALIAADLSHPAIAAPLGTGLSDITPYLAQDFVTADSLDVVIRSGGSSSPAEVSRVATQFGAALDFAAGRGILHGALHPRDVMLSADDVRITGFGVARALEQVQFNTLVRRPYSAPERAVGGPWDGRADMFSFASLMFELLFGRRVAGAGERAVVSLPEIAGANRTALKKVFAKALSGDPAGRFTSGVAFAEALQQALIPREIESAPTPSVAPPAPHAARGEDAPVPVDEFRLVPPVVESPRDVVALPALPLEAPLPVGDAVDLDLHDQAIDEAAATAAAHEQESAAQSERNPKRGKRKLPWERMRATVARPKADAADFQRTVDVVVPPVADGPIAEQFLEQVDAETAPAPRAEHNEADLRDVEAAAEGLERWMAARDQHPGGAAELVTADAATAGQEYDALDLRVASTPHLFDDDRFAIHGDAHHDHAAEAPLRESPSDDAPESMALHDADTPRNGDRSAGALASMALESTRTAVWPLVLALVVGAAVGFGIAVPFLTREARPAEEPLAIVARPAPTVVDEPAIVPESPSLGVRAGTPEPAATAAPPTAPVLSEPIATAPATRTNADTATAAARPAPPVERPRALTGRLVVRSTPPGARVQIDGKAAGVTPLTVASVAAGAHTVRLQREGYVAADRRITVTDARPNNTLAVDLARVPPPARTPAPTPAARRAPVAAPPAAAPEAATGVGALVVDSRPARATVYLDGRVVGTTPLSLTGLSSGSHPLVLEMQGFRRWTTSVTIVAGQQVRVGASLEQ